MRLHHALKVVHILHDLPEKLLEAGMDDGGHEFGKIFKGILVEQSTGKLVQRGEM